MTPLLADFIHYADRRQGKDVWLTEKDFSAKEPDDAVVVVVLGLLVVKKSMTKDDDEDEDDYGEDAVIA